MTRKGAECSLQSRSVLLSVSVVSAAAVVLLAPRCCHNFGSTIIMFVFLAVGRSCGCNAIVTVDSTIDPGFLNKNKGIRGTAQVPRINSSEITCSSAKARLARINSSR